MSFLSLTPGEREAMCRAAGVSSVEELWSAIPAALRLDRPLRVPEALAEPALLRELERRAEENQHLGKSVSFLGGGMADHFIPSVVGELLRRSEFYTAYTPYQPEVAQGSLQAAYEYQTMIARLTGMEVSNASVHDGPAALSEAVLMAVSATGRARVVVSTSVGPRYRETLRTYASGGAFELAEIAHRNGASDREALAGALDANAAAMVVARPNHFGAVEEPGDLGAQCREAGALFIMVTEPVSLALLAPPAAFGADIAVGDGQPFGNALSLGGPTFGYLACTRALVRRLPGRIVGRTVDAEGRTAYVLTLQTREQHIRREKATSNICTSSNLNALAGAIHLSCLGEEGLREVATHCLQKSHFAARRLAAIPGVALTFAHPFFKEFALRVDGPVESLLRELAADGFLVGPPLGRDYPELHRSFLVCVTECRTGEEIDRLAERLAARMESLPRLALA